MVPWMAPMRKSGWHLGLGAWLSRRLLVDVGISSFRGRRVGPKGGVLGSTLWVVTWAGGAVWPSASSPARGHWGLLGGDGKSRQTAAGPAVIPTRGVSFLHCNVSTQPCLSVCQEPWCMVSPSLLAWGLMAPTTGARTGPRPLLLSPPRP